MACRIATVIVVALCMLCPGLPAGDATTHWAYQPLQGHSLPMVREIQWPRTPVDSFVLAKLESHGLSPSPEAMRRELLRRVSFDLVGLPPTPAEVNEFLGDNSPQAYEHVVDKLLASPRYGERWARHWMDVAHFAETHGHDQDRIRTNAWPYRDYLIASLNADKPYAKFVQEQVAGDECFPDDPQATVALGFVAAGPWDESSLRDIREDTIDRQIGRYLDRDDMLTTVMQTFTSTTVQCARCHDHKFDPIPQRDYYALQAVFAGVDRANRAFDEDRPTHRRRQELVRERQKVDKGDKSLLLSESSRRQVAEWESRHASSANQWIVLHPLTFLSLGGATMTRLGDGSILAGGARPDRDTYTLTAQISLPSITALRLEVLSDSSLPHNGPGRQDNGNFHLSELECYYFAPDSTNAVPLAITRAASDFNQTGWTIEHATDHNEKTAWGIHPKVGEPHQAVLVFSKPMQCAPHSQLVVVLKQLHGEGHVIGRVRLSVSGNATPALQAPIPADIVRVLQIPDAARSVEQRAQIAAQVLKQQIAADIGALPKPSLVYAAASEFEPDGGLKPSGGPRLVQVLRRGEISKPMETATPGALRCMPGLSGKLDIADPQHEGQRRAALAHWLTRSDNPLVWRSIVNRIWHHHFGRGLVETPNDFGRMGSPPSHPELLDWLVLWFRDQAHGSIKSLHRLLVTSATYRQSARVAQSAAAQLDADNRWLWHMNRSRLDAEEARDAMLQMAGALDLRMGGPGDQQFELQPGIHVTPKVDYSKFDVSRAASMRRSVYRFLFRTLPDPFMDALDCPAGDQLTPVRNASVTVQQALALWNSALALQMASRLARQLEAKGLDLPAQVEKACDLVWQRRPSHAEAAELAGFARQHGLAEVCRVLLNSNEFMFVD